MNDNALAPGAGRRVPPPAGRGRARAEARSARAAAAAESLSIEHRRSQALYAELHHARPDNIDRAWLEKRYPDLEAARAALEARDV